MSTVFGLGQGDEGQDRRSGLGVPGRLVLVGVIGIVAALLVALISWVGAVRPATTSQAVSTTELSDVRKAADASAALAQTGAELRGFQFAYSWDVVRSGQAAAFAPNQANFNNYQAAATRLQETLQAMPTDRLTAQERSQFQAAQSAWVSSSPRTTARCRRTGWTTRPRPGRRTA